MDQKISGTDGDEAAKLILLNLSVYKTFQAVRQNDVNLLKTILFEVKEEGRQEGRAEAADMTGLCHVLYRDAIAALEKELTATKMVVQDLEHELDVLEFVHTAEEEYRDTLADCYRIAIQPECPDNVRLHREKMVYMYRALAAEDVVRQLRTSVEEMVELIDSLPSSYDFITTPGP